MIRINEENKRRLEQIDEVILDELQTFEGEVITEIEGVAKDFMTHQTNYAKQVYSKNNMV